MSAVKTGCTPDVNVPAACIKSPVGFGAGLAAAPADASAGAQFSLPVPN
jgi:hypothetical protein